MRAARIRWTAFSYEAKYPLKWTTNRGQLGLSLFYPCSTPMWLLMSILTNRLTSLWLRWLTTSTKATEFKAIYLKTGQNHSPPKSTVWPIFCLTCIVCSSCSHQFHFQKCNCFTYCRSHQQSDSIFDKNFLQPQPLPRMTVSQAESAEFKSQEREEAIRKELKDQRSHY